MDTVRPEPEVHLRQELKGFQIFFIVISTVIGIGCFTNSAQALVLGGPMCMLLCVLLFGLVTVCVGETVAEFVQLFPAPNAIFEYVHAFVDEELAWVIGIAYWYTWASIFANEMLNAAKIIQYWNPGPIWPPLAFYGIAPLAMLALNMCGVKYFGWVETVGGVLKVVMILGVSIVLCDIAREGNAGGPSGPIADGFQHNPSYATTNGMAFCFAFPLVALGYLGIESTAVAAFEARSTPAIAFAARTVHWAVFFLYTFVTIGIVLTVKWDDPRLPAIYGGIAVDRRSPPSNSTIALTSDSAVVISAHSAGRFTMAGFINACLVFSVMSAANSALYTASRTMYGLTCHIKGSTRITRFFQKASRVTRHPLGVPVVALFATTLLSYWLPFLQLNSSLTIQDVIEFIALTSSIACVLVWAALCLAFIRFQRWTHLCATELEREGFGRFIRHSTPYADGVRTVLFGIQPAAAWFGLLGCILVLAFVSATWWTTPVSFIKVAAAYGCEVIAFVVWAGLKIYRRKWRPNQWWVQLDLGPVPKKLIKRLQRLEKISEKGATRQITTHETNGSVTVNGTPLNSTPAFGDHHSRGVTLEAHNEEITARQKSVIV